MTWSIFDPKNSTTLDEVRKKFGVSDKRVSELREGLQRAKKTVEALKQVKAEKKNERRAPRYFTTPDLAIKSKSDLLRLLNDDTNKKFLRNLIVQGKLPAYASKSARSSTGVHVHMIVSGWHGRLKIEKALATNPERIDRNGLFLLKEVSAPVRVNYQKVNYKSFRPHGVKGYIFSGGQSRSSSAPHVAIVDAIKESDMPPSLRKVSG